MHGYIDPFAHRMRKRTAVSGMEGPSGVKDHPKQKGDADADKPAPQQQAGDRVEALTPSTEGHA